jgi:WD40 repeat protein
MWAASVVSMLPNSEQDQNCSEQDCPPNTEASIEIHDAATGKILRTIPTAWGSIAALKIAPGGLLHAVGCGSESEVCEGSVGIWNLASGQPVKSYPLDGETFTLSPDGRWLATIYSTKEGYGVKLLELSSGEVRWRFAAQNPRDVAFSPDGREVAVTESGYNRDAHYERAIELLSVATGAEMETFRAGGEDDTPEGFVLAFSPDGKRLAAATYVLETRKMIACASQPHEIPIYEHSIKIWDVTTGRELLTLGGQEPQ